jgi:hypothetical protein
MNASAGYGGLLIRNLRKPTDYAKATMTQDQLLKIAVANDANIAKARQEVRLGVPPPVPPANLKTAEENALDLGKQESDAVRNVLDLGFTYDESARIVASLSSDELFKLNRSYPSIKADFATNYDVKLITPTFFVDYLQKFFEELDASKGVSSGYGLGYIRDKFDELIDTSNELRAVIPTKDQIKGLQDVMEQSFTDLPSIIVQPIMERLEILNALLPDGAVYQKLDDIQREDQALAYRLNQELQNALQGLPSREQVERVLMDLADSRVSNGDALQRIELIVNDMDTAQTQQLQQIVGLINQQTAEIREGKYVEGDVIAVANVDVDGELIPFGILSLDRKTIVMITSTGEKVKMNAGSLNDFNRMKQAETGINPKLTYSKLRSDILTNSDPALVQAVNADQFATAEHSFEKLSDITGMTGMTSKEDRSIDSSRMKGAEPKIDGKGLVKSKKIPKVKIPKVKVGVGIANKKEPPYRQLGKYVIHWKQLNDNDMLNVKYKSLGRIPQFKPIPVSDVFKEYLIDVMNGGKHNQRHYENIPVEERKIWEKIVNGAGLAEHLKIKKTISDDDNDEMERFEMLKGQYLAGNNNPSVIRELRRFVVKFLSDGRLKRNQALDLLLELSV